MKNLIFFLFLTTIGFNAIAQQDNCTNFDNQSTSNWVRYNMSQGFASTDNLAITSSGASGEPSDYSLDVNDKSGSTFIINTVDFSGDYRSSDNDCLCFDFKMVENQDGVTMNPSFYLFSDFNPQDPISWGSNPVYAARFTSNTSIGSNSEWVHVCAPVKDCVDGSMPSSDEGSWGMISGGSCDDWEVLLSEVSAAVLPVDVTGWTGSERYFLDNFCIESCSGQEPIYEFDPCCPPMNPTLLADLIHFVPTGSLASPYKVEMVPNEAFTTQMQAYTDYLAALNPNVNSLSFGWWLMDMGDGDEPLPSYFGLGMIEEHFRNFVPGGNGMNWTGFYTSELEPNNWYKVAVSIWINGVEIFDLSCSDDDFINFNFQIFGGNLVGQVSDANENLIRQPIINMERENEEFTSLIDFEDNFNLLDDLKLTVSPSPSSSNFTIYFDSPLYDEVDIRVLSVNGQVVHSGTIKNGTSNYQFDLGNEAPGLYTVEISIASGMKYFERIVKS